MAGAGGVTEAEASSARNVVGAGRVVGPGAGADKICADALLLYLWAPGEGGYRNIRRRSAALMDIDVAAAVPRLLAAVDAEVVGRVGMVSFVMPVHRVRVLREGRSDEGQQ